MSGWMEKWKDLLGSLPDSKNIHQRKTIRDKATFAKRERGNRKSKRLCGIELANGIKHTKKSLKIWYDFEWYDQRDSLDIMFLDFSKVFDKVPHKSLIKKIGGLRDSWECLEMDSEVARG